MMADKVPSHTQVGYTGGVPSHQDTQVGYTGGVPSHQDTDTHKSEYPGEQSVSSEHNQVSENGHLDPASDFNDFATDSELDLITKTLQEHAIPCAVCKNTIATTDGITINNKFYHRACFVCGICNTNFDPSDEIFIGIDNKILCTSCKGANPDKVKTVDLCVYCKKPLDSAAMVALDYRWHPECFVCVDCGIVLTGFFRDSGGVPYCEPCWLRNFAKVCEVCGEHIAEQVMKIEDSHYHVNCVKCSVCKKTFDNVLDILTIDCDFWHVECFKETESDSESACSTSSALLGIYNKSLGFSAVHTSPPLGNTNSNNPSRKISTVSFAAAPRARSVADGEVMTPRVETITVTSQESKPGEDLHGTRTCSRASTKSSKCCVIS